MKQRNVDLKEPFVNKHFSFGSERNSNIHFADKCFCCDEHGSTKLISYQRTFHRPFVRMCRDLHSHPANIYGRACTQYY